MTIRTKTEIRTNIAADLADNNAGLISAQDVRKNMDDIAHSINSIVGSGNHNTEFPFTGSDVRAKITDGNYGMFIAESGVNFPNGGGTQYEPYPGAGGIDHNDLANRNASNDAHTQYLAIDGTRAMQGNLPMSNNNWIGASGYIGSGLKFTAHPDLGREDIHVGLSGNFVFHDGSRVDTAKSNAKAWINFDGSGTSTYGTPVVNSSYNIDSIEYMDAGKYRIAFTSGTFKDNAFIAIGTSNSRATSASKEDFEINTVGIVARSGDDAEVLRSLTFCVLNAAGNYVDAEVNDLVVYGLGSGTTAEPTPTIITKPAP